jgi:small subunit ribosomal protein SAe
LAREVLLLRGKINRQIGFVVDEKVIVPDLYFYRDPQEQEKEEPVETEQKETWPAQPVEGVPEFGAPTEPVKLDFDVPHITDWAAASEWDNTPAQESIAPAAAVVPPPPQQEPKQDDWATSTDTGGW